MLQFFAIATLAAMGYAIYTQVERKRDDEAPGPNEKDRESRESN